MLDVHGHLRIFPCETPCGEQGAVPWRPPFTWTPSFGKIVRLWPRGEVGSLKVPPAKSKVRSCVREGPAVVPVYPDLQGFWERAGAERVAGEVTAATRRWVGVGGSSCSLASRQRAAVMTEDERGASRSVPTAGSGRSCPWTHRFCFPGHVVCD